MGLTAKKKKVGCLPKKKKIGRPPITTKNLPKNWKDIILNLSAQGYSGVEIRAELCLSGKGKNVKFHQQVWEALKHRDEEFSCTVKIGRDLCEAWWKTQGRKALKAKVFQTGCWYANMKNRFQWSDRQEIDIGGQQDNPIYVKVANLTDVELNAFIKGKLQ